jgi:hypothetical protein
MVNTSTGEVKSKEEIAITEISEELNDINDIEW